MSRNVVVAVVSAVVVVAAAIALLFVVREVGEDELALPDRVEGMPAADDPDAYADYEPDPAVVDRQREAAEYDAEGWSDAFDGAAAASRTYVAGTLDGQVTVQAVAADAGPLLPPNGFVDAPTIGLALPLTERVVDGDVECLLQRVQPPRAGTDYQPDQAVPDAVTCQRRSGTLTVRAQSADLDRDRVTAVVQSVWDELGG